jgi:hypothetical protein
MHTHTCQRCGKSFEAIQRQREFCGRLCANQTSGECRRSYAEATCKQCGKKFTYKPYQNHGTQRQFCGITCSNLARVDDLVANVRQRGQPPVTLTCQQCGQPFTILACYLPRKYCSQKCHGAARVGKPSNHRAGNSPTSLGKGGVRLDLGIYFRSRWEANYARYLRHAGHTFTYEPDRFIVALPDGTQHAYTPDFLVDGQHYVEIKGWLREDRRQAELIAAAKTVLPKPLMMITRDGYRKIERQHASKIEHWEYSGDEFPKAAPRKCPTCGKQVTSADRKTKYCSSRCFALNTPNTLANLKPRQKK